MTTKSSTSQQATSTATATPEEQELNRLALERQRAAQSGQMQAEQGALNIYNQLLTGGTLPGNLSGLTTGIDEATTQQMVQRSLEDIRPGLQASGVYDSGVRAALEAETASGIRTNTKEYNLNLLANLLSTALTGQVSSQNASTGLYGTTANTLSGLRTTTSSGSTTSSSNPFLQSFYSSLGQGLGSGTYSGKSYFGK